MLALPFRGRWLAQMSPARRVPSHGTHLFATTYAIDFVAVHGRRTANAVDWRTVLSVEPPERFVGYGQPILAPAPVGWPRCTTASPTTRPGGPRSR